ncbi:Ppx/GppA phosphatase family protein [Hufsiella ginkgonis]|uniref:Exopolyphosphatase n=1 Tax=Hufsiella ginkgonis TaxID=2695274 RepID=A0A7K1XXX4_9SPHI|nr:exopolyphosphatase [Hufsiella ginkgonis]MXV15589.1 exopolyphosphatase [Hufsiella ginkgonis]
MPAPVAVIDLGTNTFHLLIAIVEAGAIREVVHRVDAVKLGEGGINSGRIRDDAFGRGLTMLRNYALQIHENNASPVRAIATSAIRNAANGPEFIKKVAQETGICIEVIDGAQEAAFIYKGIRASGSLGPHRSLIMDIGGGSVEFILCTQSGILWKQSFEIGAARLMDRYHHSDPIAAREIARLEQYLEEQLQPLFAAVKTYPVKHLVGSAGSFETFVEMTGTSGASADNERIKTYHFNLQALAAVMDWLRNSTHRQREERQDIEPVRVDMIVVASLVTAFVMRKSGITRVSMSAYSLKEGVLADVIS